MTDNRPEDKFNLPDLAQAFINKFPDKITDDNSFEVSAAQVVFTISKDGEITQGADSWSHSRLPRRFMKEDRLYAYANDIRTAIYKKLEEAVLADIQNEQVHNRIRCLIG